MTAMLTRTMETRIGRAKVQVNNPLGIARMAAVLDPRTKDIVWATEQDADRYLVRCLQLHAARAHLIHRHHITIIATVVPTREIRSLEHVYTKYIDRILATVYTMYSV